MTLDRINDGMMILLRVDGWRMYCKRNLFEWGEWGWQSQHGHLDLNCRKVLHDGSRGCVIFRQKRKTVRKICVEKLKLPRFEKRNLLRPEKEKFALKNKGDKYASSEIPKKIKAHHIAQLYDRLKQTILLSLSSGSLSMSVDATSAAGILLLLPPALSPAAALLLAQRVSPTDI